MQTSPNQSKSLLKFFHINAWSGLLLFPLLAACTSQSAADGTPPVSTAALPGPPGMPNPSATDPNPRGYGPTSTTGSALGGGVGAGGIGR